MKSVIVLFALLFALSSAVYTQEKAGDGKTRQADSIVPLEIRARWWRAVAEQADAQSAAQQKAAVSQSIVEEMTKFCGDRTLIRNAKGEPDCAAAEKPAEKPAEKKP